MTSHKHLIAALEERIAYTFKDRELIERALTHKSYTNENAGTKDNERLEFLGDSVLSLIVSTHLFQKFEDEDEGKLTQRRASVVSTDALYQAATKHKLGEFLRLGRGQEKSGQEHRAITACVVESIIGAAYLDGGYEVARKVCEFLLGDLSGSAKQVVQDAKTILQERFQKALHKRPTYELSREEGPDHAPQFFAKAMLEKHEIGSGKGASKKEASRAAAKDALTKHESLDDEMLAERYGK